MSFTASAPFGRKNSRSKINLFDACRISCFFASSFLVCDGHWSKKLEVKNQLIRRLSNKLLFRHEKSRAEPEASNSLTLGRVFSMSRDRFIYFSRLVLIFNAQNSGVPVQARVFSSKSSFSRKNSRVPVQARVFSTNNSFSRKNSGVPVQARVFSSRLAPKESTSTWRPKVAKS